MTRKLKSNLIDRNAMTGSGDLDWKPLYRALQDSIEWALDVAAKLAAPYPEEVESVENVRRFVRLKLAGCPSAAVRLSDLMLTFGIIIAAIERDREPAPEPDIEALLTGFNAHRTSVGTPSVFRTPAAIRLGNRK